MMRKSIFLMMFLMLYLFVPMHVKAEIECHRTSMDEDEIRDIQNSEERLLNEIKSMIPMEQNEGIRLDFDDAFKVYVDANLFEDSSITREEIESRSYDESVWLIPVYSDSRTYWITVTKGQEVTEEARAILSQEEIEDLELKVGQWTVPEITESEGRYSYTEAISQVMNEQGVQDGSVYIFGGTKGYRELLAVVCAEEKVYFLPLKNVMDHTLKVGAQENLDKPVFSFEEMKGFAGEGILQEGEVGGVGDEEELRVSSFENRRIIIVCILGVVVGVVSVVCIKRRRFYEK